MSPATQTPIERVSADDLMQKALEVGPLPMHIGAVLVLDGELDLAGVRATMTERIGALPRMRQRMVRAPLGCGRPIWLDDDVDMARHIRAVRCPAPGDERALLETAVACYTQPLPTDRPLWCAVLVTGLAAGRSALVLVVHHVLADGIGGLGLLAGLVDGAPTPMPQAFPRPRPSRRRLAADAWVGRWRGLARLPAGLRTLRPAAAELGSGGRPRAAHCSLLHRLEPRLRIAVAQVPLEEFHQFARAHGATVNDAVLAAVAGALGELLARRGEDVGHLVISVPVTARTSSTPGAMGNRVGIMPVTVPTGGDGVRRLEQVAAVTRARKSSSRGSSAALSRPVFRVLAALGILRPLIRRQTMVNTFVTNVRGPQARPTFAGATVADVIPLGIVSGNVTVAFTVLSYAGTLTVGIAAEPTACPDLDDLQELLQAGLDELAVAPSGPGASGS